MGLRLIGEVALDGSGFEAGLNKLEHGAERVGETLKGLALAAVGVYGIENAIHKTVETADKLVDTSRRLGVSLEVLQELGYAAKQNGADIDKLTTFIEKLNSTRIDPKKFESFAKLGISQPDLSSFKVEDLIMKLSVNLRNRSSQEVIGPLREIGGKGAGEMLVMLKDNLEEVREEARKLGLVMKTEDAVMLKFLADEMTILSQVIMTQLAPAIVTIMEIVLKGVSVLKGAATMLGTFSGKQVQGRALSTIWDEIKYVLWGGGQAHSLKELKNAFDETKADAVESAVAGADEMLGGFMQIENLKADLVRKQKEIEKINSIPDFESVMGEKKEKRNRGPGLYTDSLVGVGNFLGSARNPMISIAQTQTGLLRQIAQNTGKKPRGGREPGHELPHH